MSVTANDRRYGPISITGAGQALSVDFRIQNDADALVILYDSSATTYLHTGSGLTLNTHYTISSKTDTGFTMTFASTIGASGDTAWVLDKRDPKTYVSFTAADPLPPETLQKLAIDTLTQDIQSLKEIVGRCLQLPPQTAKKSTKDRTSVELDVPDYSATDASKVLSLNASGDAMVWSTPTDASAITVTSFAETLLDDTTAAAARTTLAVPSDTEAILADGSNAFSANQSMGTKRLTNYGASGGEVPWILYQEGASLTFSNTTDETTILTTTVPANALGADGKLRADMALRLDYTTSTPTLTLRFKFGSTTVVTQALATSAGGAVTDGPLHLEFEIFNENDTASQGNRMILRSGRTDMGLGSDGWISQILAADSTEDTTGALAFTITAQWDAASASNAVEVAHAVVTVYPS